MSDKVQIHVRVSKRTRQRLKLMADDDGTSLMAIAEALIEQALEKEGASVRRHGSSVSSSLNATPSGSYPNTKRAALASGP